MTGIAVYLDETFALTDPIKFQASGNDVLKA